MDYPAKHSRVAWVQMLNIIIVKTPTHVEFGKKTSHDEGNVTTVAVTIDPPPEMCLYPLLLQIK